MWSPTKPAEIDYNLVQLRRTFRDGGDVTQSMSTCCARRGELVEDETCESCPHQRGMCFDPVERTWYRLCWRDENSADASAAPAPIESIQRITAASLLRGQVVCVAPEASLSFMTALFLARVIDAAPVVDADGRPLGLVSRTDLLRAWSDAEEGAEIDRGNAPRDVRELGAGFHLENPTPVAARDVMMSMVFALPATATVGEVAALMAYEHVHHVVLTGDGGRVVGLVSALDLASCLASSRPSRGARAVDATGATRPREGGSR